MVWIGAESGSQEVLDSMNKGTRVEQVREAARMMRQVGIRRGIGAVRAADELADVQRMRRGKVLEGLHSGGAGNTEQVAQFNRLRLRPRLPDFVAKHRNLFL